MASLLLHLLISLSYLPFVSAGNYASSIEVRRKIVDNKRMDDPLGLCRNGGIHSSGRCQCRKPHTGEKCEDFACVHGMSVGHRYNPKSLLFSRPCICEPGYYGDLCDHHKEMKCSSRGEYDVRSNRCDCMNGYFGDHCQYVTECDHGQYSSGWCKCDDGWTGDFCSVIICHHGTADLSQNSQACVCSIKFAGTHCEMCRELDVPTSPYPHCNPLAPLPKKKGIKLNSNKTRVYVIAGASCTLVFMLVGMFYLSYRVKKSTKETVRRTVQERELTARKALLEQDAILSAAPSQEMDVVQKKQKFRKASIPNFFKYATSRNSKD